MVKSRFWIGMTLAPILFATAGCVFHQRPFSTARRGMPPRKLMSIAQKLERQGRTEEAKHVYMRVLAIQPDYPDALRSLDALVAKESSSNDQLKSVSEPATTEQLVSRTDPIAKGETSANTTESLAPSAIAPREETATPIEQVATTESLDETEAGGLDREPFLSTPELAALPVPLVIPETSLPSPSPADATDLPSPVEVADAKPEKKDNFQELDAPFFLEEYLPPSPARFADFTREPAAASDVIEIEQPELAKAVSESSSTPEPLSIVEQDLVEAPEAIQFVAPLVQRAPLATEAELERFFETFHVGMVKTLREQRARYQPLLAKIAADQNADSDTRSRAVFLLGSVGPAAIDVVPTLRHEMHYEVDEFLRIDLAEAILKICPEDEDAIRVLVAGLKSDEFDARWISAFALRSAASSRAAIVIGPLIEAQKTDNLKLKRMVFLTLAEFGPAAAKAVPELEAALECPDLATRQVARAALESILHDRKTSENSRKTASQPEFAANK